MAESVPYFRSNTIYCGDCKDVLAKFPKNSVDLIYLDPPFFSNRNHEVIWGDNNEIRAFQDRWKGGINNFCEWMEERILECHRVLKDTGALYLHCDYRANSYLRIILDKIFGNNKMENEIIWYYRGGGVPKKTFARRHDTIYFYTKGKKWTFNVDPIRTKYSSDTVERTKYTARAFRGKKIYDKYKPNPLGKHPDDVLQIQPTMPSSKERLGYPTQKPERLLEVIIKASSNPTDIVLDPFCGCGTALAVAQKSGRKWIGIDISSIACDITAKRMDKLGSKEIPVVGMPMNETQLRKLTPFKFQNWVVQRVFGTTSQRKSGDMGIDGYTEDKEPIQVKQSDSVGRNIIDNFETALRRSKHKTGLVIAFSFGKGAYEEIARAKRQEGLGIKLITVSDLLKKQRQLLTA